jgi:hypothetical protein
VSAAAASTEVDTSPAQWLMETRAFAALYETPVWRPRLDPIRKSNRLVLLETERASQQDP